MAAVYDGQLGVLGSLLIDPAGLAGEIFNRVSPEDFRDESYRALFSAARELFLAGSALDPVTISDRAGGGHEPLLAEVMRMTPTAGNWEAYVEILLKQSRLGEAHACGFELANARDIGEIGPILDRLNGLVVGRSERRAVGMKEAMRSFFDRHQGEPPQYLKWGMPALDEKLYCEPGDFVILGGYPSAGKTILGVQFALQLARMGKRVGFFSLETKPEKLTDRLMSHQAQVPMDRIKLNRLSSDEWKRCSRAAEENYALNLEQVPAAGMTAAAIQAYALSRRYDTVVIDYIQLVRGSSRRDDLHATVTEVSMALHEMAQRFGITVIALAQLSRPDKTMKNPPPPTMSSLKESGQLEQDADIILLLYQEDPNDYRSNRILKLAKNKEGERSRILLEFHGEVQTLTPAPPSKAESYAAVHRAAAAARKERLQQVTLYEMAPGEGGELPFQ